MGDRENRQSDYRDYLKSQEWQSIRKKVLDERGAKCERCGSKDRIEVHHKEYAKVRGTETLDMLEVLCHRCHISHHVQSAPAEIIRSSPFEAWNRKNDEKKKQRPVKKDPQTQIDRLRRQANLKPTTKRMRRIRRKAIKKLKALAEYDYNFLSDNANFRRTRK